MADRDELTPIGDDFWAPEEDGDITDAAGTAVSEVADPTEHPTQPLPLIDYEGSTDEEPDADSDPSAAEGDAIASEYDSEDEFEPADEVEESQADGDEAEPTARPRLLDDVSRWLLRVAFALIIVLLATTGAMLYYLTTLNHAPRTAIEREVVTWETAVAENPGNATSWGQLAYAYAASERWDDALKTVDRGIATTDQLALLVVRADILRFAGRYAEAKDAYDDAEAAIKKLVAKLKKEQEKKGVFVELPDQSLTGVYFGRGLTEHKLGDLDAAIADVKKAVEITPEQAAMSVTLGQLYLEAGDKAKAKEMFSSALQYVPDDKDALEGLEKAGGAN